MFISLLNVFSVIIPFQQIQTVHTNCLKTYSLCSNAFVFDFYFFRYEGKLWYINLDGSFDVLFNDGDRRTCLPAPLVRWTGSTTDGSKQPKQQTEQSATKIDYKLGEYNKRVHRVFSFYSSSLISNLFHCHFHVLLYSETPKQVIFNPINMFGHLFYHTLLLTLLLYIFFSFFILMFIR